MKSSPAWHLISLRLSLQSQVLWAPTAQNVAGILCSCCLQGAPVVNEQDGVHSATARAHLQVIY